MFLFRLISQLPFISQPLICSIVKKEINAAFEYFDTYALYQIYFLDRFDTRAHYSNIGSNIDSGRGFRKLKFGLLFVQQVSGKRLQYSRLYFWWTADVPFALFTKIQGEEKKKERYQESTWGENSKIRSLIRSQRGFR